VGVCDGTSKNYSIWTIFLTMKPEYLYYDFLFNTEGDIVLEVKLPTKKYLHPKDRYNIAKRKILMRTIRRFMDSALQKLFEEFDTTLSWYLQDNVKIVALEYMRMYIFEDWIKIYYRVRYVHIKPKKERDVIIE